MRHRRRDLGCSEFEHSIVVTREVPLALTAEASPTPGRHHPLALLGDLTGDERA